MSTLYNQQSSNVHKTWLLIGIFLILIIGIGWAFSYVYQAPQILYFAVAFSLFMNFLSYWYSDKIALSISGARAVSREQATELYRVVENLSITSGLQMPRIYIISSPQINAFATGRNEKHSAIAVTTGSLERLEKIELEGVLAHELSHIKNKDILVSSVAVVLAGVIALLADVFLRMSFFGFGRRSDEREGGNAIGAILALVTIILAPFVATLLRLAVSRKREFLADASGALLTRYPEGLARALEKIGQDDYVMKGASNATAHLFIANPLKGKERTNWFAKLMMTHPPLEERIRVLRGMRV